MTVPPQPVILQYIYGMKIALIRSQENQTMSEKSYVKVQQTPNPDAQPPDCDPP